MRKIASKFLQATGIVLIVLGIVHLIATPHIPALLNGMKARADYQQALGPTLLNHVLVGALLMPLGYATWLASAPRHVTQGWARRLLLVNSLAVLALPISIVMFMRDPRYYGAPLFVGGVALVAVLSVLMLAAAGLLLRDGANRPDAC